MKYEIAESRLSSFLKQIEKMNKKAKKYGLAPFTWTELARYPVVVQDASDKEWQIMAIAMDIVGPEIRKGVFGLVGKIDRRSTPVLYSSLRLSIPSSILELAQCDHCHTSRGRKETWLLRNEETHEFIQVGTSCLEEFTGITPASALKYADLWFAVTHLGEEYDPRGGGSGKLCLDQVTMPLSWILGLCLEAIHGHGYISRTKGNETGQAPTADRVWAYIEEGHVCHSDTAKEVVDLLRWATAKYAELEAGSAWDISLGNIVKSGSVSKVTVGYAAWLAHAWKQEYASEPILLTHIGKVSEKVSLDVLVYEHIEVQGGPLCRSNPILHKMKDMLGNHLAWFCSGKALELGKHTVKGTVKAHSEFNGKPQTVLTRVKLV